MPTRHEHWTCNVCGAEWDAEEAAATCEKHGYPIVPPVGTIIWDQNYLGDMLLLVVVARMVQPGQCSRKYHTADLASWVWRDLSASHSPIADRYTLYDTSPQSGNTCITQQSACTYPITRKGGGGVPFTVTVDITSPRYLRCWKDMVRAGLPLFFWVEGRAVPAELPPAILEVLASIPLEKE